MTKILIIGGGPGGYVAGIRAAQQGAEVKLIEADTIGGTCLNIGCIPTKSLLHSAELYRDIKNSEMYGIEVGDVEVNWDKVQDFKEQIVQQLTGGVSGLLRGNGAEIIDGRASFIDKRTVEVEKSDGSKEILEADNIIIATGSSTVMPKIEGADTCPAVIDSTDALSLEEIPESLVVIGGGVIGVELATVYNNLGTKVIILEALDKILPLMDGEIAAGLKESLIEDGIDIHTNAFVQAVRSDNGKGVVEVDLDGEKVSFTGEKVLIAVGRKPNTEGLNLENAGVRSERGAVKVNPYMETNVRGIYAIGDCTGEIMLAHLASVQGEIAAENILGASRIFDNKTNPSCVYTVPECAGVGMTEEEVKEKNIPYYIGHFPMIGNGKALIESGGQGFVKLIFAEKYDELLGAHMIGPRSTELIMELALALNLEATADEIISTIHGHPTISESIREAALKGIGKPIYII